MLSGQSFQKGRCYALAFFLCGAPFATAADMGRSLETSAAEVPGDDIFGFTSPSDVGKPGDHGIAIENSFRLGKRDGNYGALSTKLEYGRTLATDFWLGVSAFGSWHDMRGVSSIGADLSRVQFDGFSTEIAYRFMPRSDRHPFAATLAFEPRWARIDGNTGTQATAFSGELKLFVDAVIVPDKWFWGFNASMAPQVAQASDAGSPWVSSSSANVSTALTYQVSPFFFMGGEIRYLAAFEGALAGRLAGEALMVGPNLLYKPSEKSAINIAWTPQVAGRSASTSDTLDLDSFTRHELRLKFVQQF